MKKMIRGGDTVYYTNEGAPYWKFYCTQCAWTAESERGDWGAVECHAVEHMT